MLVLFEFFLILFVFISLVAPALSVNLLVKCYFLYRHILETLFKARYDRSSLECLLANI